MLLQGGYSGYAGSTAIASPSSQQLLRMLHRQNTAAYVPHSQRSQLPLNGLIIVNSDTRMFDCHVAPALIMW